MPLYHYRCKQCGEPARKLLAPANAFKPGPCKCGGELERTPTPATGNVVETLDNGLMPRRVVRIADVERIMAERARKKPERY